MAHLQESDFPFSYIDSNEESLKAQRKYKFFTWATLVLMFLSTLMESISKDITKLIRPYDKISGCILLFSVICSILLLIVKPEKNWYIGRAVAESIKTLSWRFMMKSEPFEDSENIAKKKFLDRCAEISKTAFENDGFDPQPISRHKDFVSAQMLFIRSLPFLDRKQIYADQRIDDQVEWYQNKSAVNKKLATTYSILIAICQLIAAIYLIFFTNLDTININSVMIFIATSAISVMEMNKYRELSQAYSFTAFELKTIRNKFGMITTELELNTFVEESEQAISREHTMWLARRGHLKLSQVKA